MIEIKREQNNVHRLFVDGVEVDFDRISPAKRAMKKPIAVVARKMPEAFAVSTLEGVMQGRTGDWLITGVQGEMYPCDAAIFEASYDLIA